MDIPTHDYVKLKWTKVSELGSEKVSELSTVLEGIGYPQGLSGEESAALLADIAASERLKGRKARRGALKKLDEALVSAILISGKFRF